MPTRMKRANTSSRSKVATGRLSGKARKPLAADAEYQRQRRLRLNPDPRSRVKVKLRYLKDKEVLAIEEAIDEMIAKRAG